ncbi:FxDxF family PEP-CTERM protein [Aquabacterium sp.]|uniref:FxDxF family PEP-CTERM protein n=1 Tax=Aquabacterium sp. TaxID=1872578 RepID=UPI0025C22116|nr:FxDxF family PEP-CTERM protein [Aquabacterium sp.]
MKFKHLLGAAALSFASVGAFADSLTFTLEDGVLTADIVGSGTTSYTFSLGSDYTFDSGITSSTVTLKSKTVGSVISSVTLDGQSFDLTTSASGTTTFYNASLSDYLLGTGSHTLTVTATGAYAGVATLTPAVPEPESMALALAGLGVAGFVARRRKSA